MQVTKKQYFRIFQSAIDVVDSYAAAEFLIV